MLFLLCAEFVLASVDSPAIGLCSQKIWETKAGKRNSWQRPVAGRPNVEGDSVGLPLGTDVDIFQLLEDNARYPKSSIDDLYATNNSKINSLDNSYYQ